MIDSDASCEDSRSIKERFQHNNVEQAGVKDMGLDKIGSQKESSMSCTIGWRLKIKYKGHDLEDAEMDSSKTTTTRRRKNAP